MHQYFGLLTHLLQFYVYPYILVHMSVNPFASVLPQVNHFALAFQCVNPCEAVRVLLPATMFSNHTVSHLYFCVNL